MEHSIKISVVIPVYNGASVIVGTLNTLRDQVSMPEEVIIVDDGSIDKTVQIIEDYIKKNDLREWKLVKSKHQGIGATRNIGIQNSKHDYIAFLDADDTWDIEKISKCRKVLKNDNTIDILTHSEILVEKRKKKYYDIVKLTFQNTSHY